MTNEQLCHENKEGRAQPIELWLQLKRFIRSIVKKYSDKADIEDLMQESYFSLLSAIKLYDEDAGGKFTTYAYFWIKQGCLRYIKSFVHVPEYARDLVWKYDRMRSEFARDCGREPTDAEVMEALGVSREILERDTMMVETKSLDAVIENDFTTLDTIPSPDDVEGEVLQRVWQEGLQRDLWQAVSTLPANEAQIIRMRYLDGLTQEQCGEKFGVSGTRVQVLEQQAFRKLRVKKELQPYLDDIRYSLGLRSGIGKFKGSGSSSTEYAALKALDYMNKLKAEGLI